MGLLPSPFEQKVKLALCALTLSDKTLFDCLDKQHFNPLPAHQNYPKSHCPSLTRQGRKGRYAAQALIIDTAKERGKN